MPKYRVSVSYSIGGFVEMMADDEEEAVSLAEDMSPSDVIFVGDSDPEDNYIDGSWGVDEDPGNVSLASDPAPVNPAGISDDDDDYQESKTSIAVLKKLL